MKPKTKTILALSLTACACLGAESETKTQLEKIGHNDLSPEFLKYKEGLYAARKAKAPTNSAGYYQSSEDALLLSGRYTFVTNLYAEGYAESWGISLPDNCRTTNPTNVVVAIKNLAPRKTTNGFELTYSTNWNGNLLSSTRSFMWTNWSTASFTTPATPDEVPEYAGLFKPGLRIRNLRGVVSSNLVADFIVDGKTTTAMISSNVVDVLRLSLPPEESK